MELDRGAVLKRHQKHINTYASSSMPPDRGVPLKKLLYALLAISLGTVVECKSRLSAVPWPDVTRFLQHALWLHLNNLD